MTDTIIVELSEKSVEKVAEKILAKISLLQPLEKEKPAAGDVVQQTFRGAREASAYLRISTGTFQALKNEGKIKQSYTVGSTCFYRAKDLDKQVSNLYEK